MQSNKFAREGVWHIIRGWVLLIITIEMVACAMPPESRRSTQAIELRYRELLRILPDDADRSRLPEQDKAVKQGNYFTKEGKLVPLLKPAESYDSTKLNCRTCQSEAPNTSNSTAKPERKQPYLIKVE